MGMYTELLLKCNVTRPQEKENRNAFDYFFDLQEELDRKIKLPNHELFNIRGCWYLTKTSSFYHHPEPILSLYPRITDSEKYYLFLRVDLKNYDNQIEYFLDWLHPFVDENHDKIIGWKWYEEDDYPTLLRKGAYENGDLLK